MYMRLPLDFDRKTGVDGCVGGFDVMSRAKHAVDRCMYVPFVV